jgi:4-hydroxy-3-polyprenylbenzoate decarboxylase
MPAFYTRPSSVEEIVDHIIGRVLDQFGVSIPQATRWQGMGRAAEDETSTPRPR